MWDCRAMQWPLNNNLLDPVGYVTFWDHWARSPSGSFCRHLHQADINQAQTDSRWIGRQAWNCFWIIHLTVISIIIIRNVCTQDPWALPFGPVAQGYMRNRLEMLCGQCSDSSGWMKTRQDTWKEIVASSKLSCQEFERKELNAPYLRVLPCLEPLMHLIQTICNILTILKTNKKN